MANDIVVNLTMNNQDFAIRVKDSGQLLRQLAAAFNTSSGAARRFDASTDSLATKFRHLVVTLGGLRFALMDINDIFLRLPASIIKSAGAIEQTQALLAGLSKEVTKAGKAAEGQSNFKFITDLAQRAPFDISALSDSFVKLKSAGIDPTNGSLQTLVDGVARFGGSSDQFKRATVAIQQMMGKGVVSMEELRQQLGEAVPTAMADMATGMGLSMAALTKAVSKGTVESTDAINKMFVIMNLRNRGAALELMGTWNGVLAQIKTRWELAANDIAQAGFMDAVKKVGGEVSAALDSNTFKRFSSDAGQSMASVLNVTADLAKTLYDFSEAIKVVAIAWLAYKTSSAFVAPFVASAISGTQSLIGMYRAQATAATQAAAGAQAAAIRAAVATRDQARAQRDASALVVAAKEAELRALQVANAAVVANAQATATALRAASASASMVAVRGANGIFNLIPRADAVRQIAALNSIANASTRAQGVVSADADRARTAMTGFGNAAAAANTNIARLAAGTTAASVGMNALRTASVAAGAVFNALGGWMTVLNVAIMAGVLLWANWESAADKAAAAGKRAMRARAGTSTEEDVKKEEKNVAAARKAMQAAQDELAFESLGSNGGNEKARQVRLAQLRKNVEFQEAEMDRASMQLLNHQRVVTERNGREEAEIIVKGVDKVLEGITAANQLKLNAIDRAKEEELKAAGADQKKKDAIGASSGLASNNLAIVEAKQYVAAIDGALKTLDVKAVGEKGDQARAAAVQLGVKLKGARAELDRALGSLNPNQIMGGGKTAKPKKGPGVSDAVFSPIDDIINGLTVKKAELDAMLPSVLSSIGKVNSVSEALAELEAKLALGMLDQKQGKKQIPADPAKVETARALTRQVAEMGDVAESAKSLSARINEMGPDYQRAIDMLANPLGDTTGRKANQFDEFLAKMRASPAQLEAAARRAGDTAEAFTAKMVEGSNMAKTIDFSAGYVSFVEEVARLNVEMIDNDLQRVNAEIANDNKLFQARIANLRATAAAMGDPAQGAALEKAIASGLTARSQIDANKLKTPMQKMLEDWQDTTKQMNAATVDWSNQTIDAFVDSARTGKLEWKGLVTDVLAGILKIQLQKQLGGAISEGFGSLTSLVASLFADGGVMTGGGAMPLKKYAAGGIASSPQMAIYGEGDTPEAYVPLPDGRRIPVAMSGGASSAPEVHVNVINQTSTPVNASKGQPRFDGRQMIVDVVLSEASKPGPFRDSMRQMTKS